jgi:flagellar basal body-associated protein FliL
VSKPTTSNSALQFKLDIVKHVITVRLAENEAATLSKDNKAKRDRILDILSRKQDAQLEGSSPEELQAMLASLS